MKSMEDSHILKSGVVSPIECLHYALNLPTSVVVTGIDSMDILHQAIQAAETFKPMTAKEVTQVLSRTAPLAASGQYEPFKTDNIFDATAMNPGWLDIPAA